ncbi:hypothetical protein F5Y18DRAFT_432503 [Xylariaceae sp. FL1019]|nr:hypothetical protein F5Y18DRAFT_432503 [Xylariaceae sp. FL1019]
MALTSLGLMTIGAIPTVIGVAEAIDAQKKQNAQAKERIKFNLTAKFSHDGDSPPQTAYVVFKDNKLYLDHPSSPAAGYRFNGFYFGYPGPEEYQGLVAPIADDPPMLNWIYADKDTGVLRHGSRKETVGHIIGPWSWTEDEEYLILEGEQFFVAVQNDDGTWCVYFDKEGDMHETLADRDVVEIELHRELQLDVARLISDGLTQLCAIAACLPIYELSESDTARTEDHGTPKLFTTRPGQHTGHTPAVFPEDVTYRDHCQTDSRALNSEQASGRGGCLRIHHEPQGRAKEGVKKQDSGLQSPAGSRYP